MVKRRKSKARRQGWRGQVRVAKRRGRSTALARGEGGRSRVEVAATSGVVDFGEKGEQEGLRQVGPGGQRLKGRARVLGWLVRPGELGRGCVVAGQGVLAGLDWGRPGCHGVASQKKRMVSWAGLVWSWTGLAGFGSGRAGLGFGHGLAARVRVKPVRIWI